MNLLRGAFGVVWYGGAMLATVALALPAQAPSAGSDKPASALQLSTNLVVGASNSSAALPLGTGSVLTLSGNGNYLELPPEPFSRLDEATLECWVKWHTFAGNEHVFEFDAAKRVKVGNRLGQSDLEFVAAAPPATTPPNAQPPVTRTPQLTIELSPIEFEKIEAAATSPETSDSIAQAGVLALNRWYHLAVVFDSRRTQLYLDGTLVGTAPYTNGLASAKDAARH